MHICILYCPPHSSWACARSTDPPAAAADNWGLGGPYVNRRRQGTGARRGRQAPHQPSLQTPPWCQVGTCLPACPTPTAHLGALSAPHSSAACTCVRASVRRWQCAAVCTMHAHACVSIGNLCFSGRDGQQVGEPKLGTSPDHCSCRGCRQRG